jgi:hypothetical protein
MSVVFSPNAGFTGGSTRSHAWISSDGACTRVAICHSGIVAGYWHFDKPRDGRSGWTNPAIGRAVSVTANTQTTLLETNAWFGTTAFQAHATAGDMPLELSFESAHANSSPFWQYYDGPNELTGEWPMMPVGLVHPTTAGRRGRHGTVFDWWWTSPSLSSGNYLPNDPDLNFVVLGDQVHVWKGDGTEILLT